MLETFRRQSRSVIIYVFFGIIIAVFIINFGPQSQGCTSTDTFAARVQRESLTENDFRYAMVMSGARDARIPRIREFVMDRLLERELLAKEAERMGFRISDDEVRALVETGTVVALGRRQDLRGRVFKDDTFDYDQFKKFCQYEVGLTVKRFLEHQKRELLAEKVRETVRASVRASDEEVLGDHVGRELQVNLEFVRLSPRKMERDVAVSPAEIDAYLAKSGEKVKERYATRTFLYTKVPREVRARHLLVAAPAGGKPAAARARAEALLAHAKAGEDFAAIAAGGSAGAQAGARGGDLGWRRKGATGLGEAIDQQLFAAKEGDLLGPIEDAAGAHLLRVEGVREGDLPLEKVRRDIAEEILREEKASALAKKTAGELLARLRAGENWESLFAAEATEDEAAGADDEEPAANIEKQKAAVAALTPWKRAETGLFPRSGSAVPKIGLGKDVMHDAFALRADQPLAEKAYDIAGSFFLVRLKERREVDMKDFEARKSEIATAYVSQKSERMLAELSKTLCVEAKPTVNPAVVASGGGGEGEEDGEGGTYSPCKTLGVE